MKNTELDLEPTTLLVGVNNSGKTTILRALQLALGGTQSVTMDDYHYSEEEICDRIVIDVLIVPVDDNNQQVTVFDDDWRIVFTTEKITITGGGEEVVSFRTVFEEDNLKKIFRKKQYVIDDWPQFSDETGSWYEKTFENESPFFFEETPFHYLDANRDILDDIRSKTSYLGRLLSSIEYEQADVKAIEELIDELNKLTISKSPVLSDLESTLSELESAMNNSDNTVNLTPFTKRVKDLNKGVNISYSEFAMDYHGMGTRSWSSLLVLKSFLKLYEKKFKESDRKFFPILAIEEPESHLHPNAQKRLYSQISSIPGQKIVSTHSSYVAGCADLGVIRSISRTGTETKIGRLPISSLDPEDLRKIRRQVINTRGELFFAKYVILFEGETEEQALPLLAERHFGKSHLELGIDFIGVGGHGNYSPFITFCESLNIEFSIFSDNEVAANESVKKQIDESTSKDHGRVVYLSIGNDFERELIVNGHLDEVKQAYKTIELAKCHNDHHKVAKEAALAMIPDGDYYDLVTKMKTQFAPVVSKILVDSAKQLPPKIIELFGKVVI